MADIKDYINDPSNWNKSPEVVDREGKLRGWTRDKGEEIAAEEKLRLTEDHWAFIEYLQRYYVDNGWPGRVHELTQHLEDAFADQGGGRYLYG
ncbi:MAG TPA: TusE/DsrC/DsvC family sulfur relay protein, partial [Arenicellales bacterium]|nr:TusE/DsrC/DsvC family sulfur relay protein [Arenicellales bacterium]